MREFPYKITLRALLKDSPPSTVTPSKILQRHLLFQGYHIPQKVVVLDLRLGFNSFVFERIKSLPKIGPFIGAQEERLPPTAARTITLMLRSHWTRVTSTLSGLLGIDLFTLNRCISS